MGKKRKHLPAEATRRPDTKQPRIRAVETGGTPSWRFSTVDQSGPFRWPCGEETEREIVNRLRQFDSMKWPEIEGQDHHSISTDKLSKSAQSRLVEIGQDDVSEVFSFHFSGKPRIIGIRDRDVVKLLWWDQDHQVCPSPKKHT